eukprot:Hpha_TRINITY_DN14485_c2_g1::TRINITY_DN14485_c2_g1_i1::g.157954::m.157954
MSGASSQRRPSVVPPCRETAAYAPVSPSTRRAKKQVRGRTDHIRAGVPGSVDTVDEEHHCGLGTMHGTADATTPKRVRKAVQGQERHRVGDLGHEGCIGAPSPRTFVSPRLSKKRVAMDNPESSRVISGDTAEPLTFSPRPRTSATLKRQRGEAIGLTLDEDLRVTAVQSGSPAAEAGVSVGAVLKQVNGEYIGSQDAAISAFRNAGESISTKFAPTGAEAGLPSSEQLAVRKQQLRMPRKALGEHSPMRQRAQTPPPGQYFRSSGFVPEPAKPIVPYGIGPPGLGPMVKPWGNPEDDKHGKSNGGFGPANTPFKPNHWTPSQLAAVKSPTRHTGQHNRTSYEVAYHSGQAGAGAGHWEPPSGPSQSITRQRYDRVHTGDPNLLRHTSESAPVAERGRRSAAVPEAMRTPASGGLPGGAEWSRTSTLRLGQKSHVLHGLNHGLITHDGTVTDQSVRRSLTPGRTRHSHQSHGDILAHSDIAFGGKSVPIQDVPPKGLRTNVAPFQAPQPRPRSPSSRHAARLQTNDTDIFHLSTHRPGTSLDMPDSCRAGKGRSQTPPARRHRSELW